MQRELAELKALMTNASEHGNSTPPFFVGSPPWNLPSNPLVNKITKKQVKQQRQAEKKRIALARAKTWAQRELDLPVPKLIPIMATYVELKARFPFTMETPYNHDPDHNIKLEIIGDDDGGTKRSERILPLLTLTNAEATGLALMEFANVGILLLSRIGVVASNGMPRIQSRERMGTHLAKVDQHCLCHLRRRRLVHMNVGLDKRSQLPPMKFISGMQFLGIFMIPAYWFVHPVKLVKCVLHHLCP